jgi:2-polyprenyl-3-methyl-5-hydroxy-6-metoxy-1,4-benzoquinol methylase
MTDIDGNDQNIFHALNFTDCYKNITATAQAFQDKYPINPVIKNVTIFAMTLMATIQFNSTKCYPSAYENLFLPLNYVSRKEAFSFKIENEIGAETEAIDSSTIQQPLVYPMAAYLGEVYNTHHIIEIGCGCGHRAAELVHHGFTVTAIDSDLNIKCAKSKFWSSFYQERIEWIIMELGGNENEFERKSMSPLYRLLSRNVESPAIIVASNIIQHLVDPFSLLALIKRLLDNGAHAAVLSTPERELMYGGIQNGPPENNCHMSGSKSGEFQLNCPMREWNLIEFQTMLRCSPGITLTASGITLSNTADADANSFNRATSIAVLTSDLLKDSEVNATSQIDLCGGIDMIRANLYGSFVCNLKNEIHPKALYVRPDRSEKKMKKMKKIDAKVRIKTTKTFAFTSMAEFLSTLQHSKVPFYIYEDDAITMNSFYEVCEWSQREDAVLAHLLRKSKWRTYDPSKAKVFFILIPYHQSYFCGSNAIRSTHVGQTYWTPDDEKIKFKIRNWNEFDQKWQTRWENRTHLERVERAVAMTIQLMKKYSSVPHVMPAFSWQSSVWNYDNQIGNYKEASQIFPLWCWQALANVILVRFEVFGMSPFYNSFSTGRLAGRTPFSMYNVLWEQTKRAVILPFVGHRDMPRVDDLTYTDWKTQREFMFWYHTTTDNSAHGGTRLRHLPVQHAQLFGNDSSMSFGIPREEWLSGFSRSKFCLVVRGDDPNSHSWIAALQACCIPVFISDHFADVCLPFGDGINGPPSWMPPLESFSFSVKESEVLQNPQRMVDVVLEASEAEVEAKLIGLLAVRKFFMYEHPESMLVEALVWEQAWQQQQ